MAGRYEDIHNWNCCFCFKLRTGVWLIGMFCLIGSIISFGKEGVHPFFKDMPHNPYAAPTFREPDRLNIFIGVRAIASFIASGLLLQGLRKEKSAFLEPFFMTFSVEFTLRAAVAVTELMSSDSAGTTALILVFIILSFVFNGYCFYAVYSYYQHLRYREYEALFTRKSQTAESAPMAV